jgi:acetyltransferase-like isoleucine patch superfamily enzyme
LRVDLPAFQRQGIQFVLYCHFYLDSLKLFVDYSCNISIGSGFYANFLRLELVKKKESNLTKIPDCLTVLDCGLVSIGNNVMIGPNVNIITGERETGIEARKAHKGLEFTGPLSLAMIAGLS